MGKMVFLSVNTTVYNDFNLHIWIYYVHLVSLDELVFNIFFFKIKGAVALTCMFGF